MVLERGCSSQSVLGVLLMKKTLLTGVAVLLLATGAQAKWKPKPPSATLPGEMQGEWCLDKDKNKWDTFHRGGQHNYEMIMSQCPDKDQWLIFSNGWKHGTRGDSCTFDEIDKLDRYVYYVRGNCKARGIATRPYDVPNEVNSTWKPSGTVIYSEVGELHYVDGALVYWQLPDV